MGRFGATTGDVGRGVGLIGLRQSSERSQIEWQELRLYLCIYDGHANGDANGDAITALQLICSQVSQSQLYYVFERNVLMKHSMLVGAVFTSAVVFTSYIGIE